MAGDVQKRKNKDKQFQQAVHRKAKQKRMGRKRGKSPWFGFGMFGLVGWSVGIPTLLFLAIGIWMDSLFVTDLSWTLMLLTAGIMIGCLNAWYWVNKEQKEIERERRELIQEIEEEAGGEE
ncbi:MAG: AtpZ/AtpI family protein [Spirochaetia bacterium]